MTNTYEEKRQARIERFLEMADSMKEASNQVYSKAKDMAGMIPFGQPILIGHHSEGRDRRYRARIERMFGSAFELQNKAEYYREKALSAQSNDAISSDDPEAIEKIKAKIARILDSNEKAKLANRAIKKAVTEQDFIDAYMITGMSIEKAEKHREFVNRCPMYSTFGTNTAEVRRLKKRLEHLEKLKTLSRKEFIINGVKVIDNPEENRIQIEFDGKPDNKTISKLRLAGFKWTPSKGLWQAYRKQWNFNQARVILNEMRGN